MSWSLLLDSRSWRGAAIAVRRLDAVLVGTLVVGDVDGRVAGAGVAARVGCGERHRVVAAAGVRAGALGADAEAVENGVVDAVVDGVAVAVLAGMLRAGGVVALVGDAVHRERDDGRAVVVDGPELREVVEAGVV